MASYQEMKDELQVLIDRATDLIDKAEARNTLDALAVAAQTHRLDLVSIILAALGLILAIGGLVAFFEIRHRAKSAAQEVAKSECREIATEILKSYLNDELPDETRRLVELIIRERDTEEDDYEQQDTNQI